MFNYQYHRPALTADVAIFKSIGFDEYSVLLIERKNNPFSGYLSLPGGFVESEHERILDAAYREMNEEVNPSVPLAKSKLRFVDYFDSPSRHPNDRVVSFCFATIVSDLLVFSAGDDAKKIVWCPVSELPELAFDHERMVRQALSVIERRNYI